VASGSASGVRRGGRTLPLHLHCLVGLCELSLDALDDLVVIQHTRELQLLFLEL
jgi:hypothetical protein